MGATTTFEDISKKIITYFGANWTTTSVQYPNTDLLDPSSLEYFVVFNIVKFPSRRLCITGNDDTGLIHTGEVVVNLYRRVGKGIGQLQQYVDDICDLFRYYAIEWDSKKIQFFVPIVNEIGHAGRSVLGESTIYNWWQVNISIRWEYLT